MRALADAYADALLGRQRAAVVDSEKFIVAERAFASLSALRNHDEYMSLDVLGTRPPANKAVLQGNDADGDGWLMPLVNYKRSATDASGEGYGSGQLKARSGAFGESLNVVGNANNEEDISTTMMKNTKSSSAFNDPFNRRHLFLYSKADVLINYHDVQRYMYALWRSERDGWEALRQEEEEEGVAEASIRSVGHIARGSGGSSHNAIRPSSSQIYSHVFEKSPHVSHFKSDKVNYTAQLENFLADRRSAD